MRICPWQKEKRFFAVGSRQSFDRMGLPADLDLNSAGDWHCWRCRRVLLDNRRICPWQRGSIRGTLYPSLDLHRINGNPVQCYTDICYHCTVSLRQAPPQAWPSANIPKLDQNIHYPVRHTSLLPDVIRFSDLFQDSWVDIQRETHSPFGARCNDDFHTGFVQSIDLSCRGDTQFQTCAKVFLPHFLWLPHQLSHHALIRFWKARTGCQRNPKSMGWLGRLLRSHKQGSTAAGYCSCKNRRLLWRWRILSWSFTFRSRAATG